MNQDLSNYDYRSKWLEMTEAFESCDSTDSILQQFLNILGCMFGTARITIWLRFETDELFHQVWTLNTEPSPKPIDPGHPVVTCLQVANDPIKLEETMQEPSVALSQFLQTTQASVCIPLRTPSHLVGFVTLGPELLGGKYGEDDFDLLGVMGHHVSMLLGQARLTEKRIASAEWEAVHGFSTVYLHDLKNLASGLSLVVQNAEMYGQDPEFQASAMRTVVNTAQRIMDLMAKLSTQLRKHDQDGTALLKEVNINSLITEIVEALDAAGCKPIFVPESKVASVSVVPEQFKQALLNLIINAQQAMNEQGTIEITSEQKGDFVVITVTDSGLGIPKAQLRTLFQPFRTTKKRGLGVGLYQCKQIVEQHGGSIRLESQEGHGTHAIIALPSIDSNS